MALRDLLTETRPLSETLIADLRTIGLVQGDMRQGGRCAPRRRTMSPRRTLRSPAPPGRGTRQSGYNPRGVFKLRTGPCVSGSPVYIVRTGGPTRPRKEQELQMSGELPVAIIFNCHYNGLSIIQELGVNGIPCVAMDSVRSVGTYSRYARYVRCPNPADSESEFVEFLLDYCAAQKLRPVLFATNDEWAVAVSRSKARLSEVAIPCVADWSAVDLVINKEKFYDVAGQRSYPVPSTWKPDEARQLSPASFPIVAKPRFRRNASDDEQVGLLRTMERLRLTVINDEQDLERFLETEESAVPHLLFQEFVPGMSDSMYTVGMYVDRNCEARGVFTGKKVRGYPADIGDCIVGEVCEVPDEIVELSMKVAGDLKLTGIMEFEYKHDVRTGSYRLIEINPRPWSWIGITPTCGVSLPLIAYQDLALRMRTAGCQRTVKADGTVRYYKAIPDFINSTIRYKRNFSKWHRTPRSWWQELRATPKVVVAEFHARDYKVGLIAVMTEARVLVSRLLGIRPDS